MRTDVLTLYKRAKIEACARGRSDMAEDFSSWYIIGILEGKRQHQTIKQAFTDYIRLVTNWNTRTESAPRLIPYLDTKDQRQHEEPEEIPKLKPYKLDPDEQKIIDLYFFKEKSMSEIAKIFNVTESRISQRLKVILPKIKKQIK